VFDGLQGGDRMPLSGKGMLITVMVADPAEEEDFY